MDNLFNWPLGDSDLLKLYRLAAESKEYWETWEADGQHFVHWGDLGTEGQSAVIKPSFFNKATSKIQKIIDKKLADGFSTIGPENHSLLMVEYAIEGFGTEADVEKRHRLETRLNETLGWTGLGACDGGSSGSGTMEVCNFVVDYDIAKFVIERDLRDTEFSNYVRIYDEQLE